MLMLIFPSVPRNKPQEVSVIDVGSTWVKLRWKLPLVHIDPAVTRYEITSIDQNGTGRTIVEKKSIVQPMSLTSCQDLHMNL